MMPPVTVEQVMALLRDDPRRRFRIDIETDSTIAADDQAEKTAAVEFTQGMGAFIKAALPLGMQVPELAPLVVELMTFLVRRFRAGRTTEEAFEQAGQQLLAAARRALAMRQQGPQTSLKDQAAAMKDAALARKAEAEAQATVVRTQAEAQARMLEARGRAQAAQAQSIERMSQARADAARADAEIEATRADTGRRNAATFAQMMRDAAKNFREARDQIVRQQMAGEV